MKMTYSGIQKAESGNRFVEVFADGEHAGDLVRQPGDEQWWPDRELCRLFDGAAHPYEPRLADCKKLLNNAAAEIG